MKDQEHLHALDDVRCLGKSYATARYISTGKSTFFAGSEWLPVGFPAENDPSLSPEGPPGRTSQNSSGLGSTLASASTRHDRLPGKSYASTDDAKKAALVYLNETGSPYKDNYSLALKVHDALSRSTRVDVSDVTVRAKNGKVRLDGTVPELAQSKDVEAIARSVPGVTVVENRLVISGGSTWPHDLKRVQAPQKRVEPPR
jgi:hypothetical protein